MTDVVRDEEIRISCNFYFTIYYSRTSSFFTNSLYSEGPLVSISALRTYWTSEGNIVSSINTSATSSYVLVRAPKDSVIPHYTCHVVCDIFSNISDISGDSSVEISSTTETIDVLCEYKAATIHYQSE